MPHDSHTTHEPDRFGREGDEAVFAEDVSRQTTLLMFDGCDEFRRFGDRTGDLAPAVN